ncbi:hypothetical protein EVAR_69666_1 [Eumeta japonica]|uniref:Uncharacterized protein n=1 Tax=Eumeta variegata TaxID=151549 RepID=A0A4C1ZQZ3_EUMVA|nr:hypothetical protein EVAR_69666_1 [Eumeta japonica]
MSHSNSSWSVDSIAIDWVCETVEFNGLDLDGWNGWNLLRKQWKGVWAVCPAVVVAFTRAHPICTDRMRTGKRNRHRRPDSPDPNPKSKRDDISINQLT